MTITVTASDAVALPVYDLPQVLAYTGSNLNTITVVYNGVTYVQTLVYTGSNVTSISNWVAQP